MTSLKTSRKKGFTLLETVIAIGVLAILLSGFMVVFAPAAAGIRKAINTQEASRLVTTVEQELVTIRGTQQVADYPTGFDKAFDYIKNSSGNDGGLGLVVYKYRASLSQIREDGTAEPVVETEGLIPGEDFVIQTMMRRKDDAALEEDIPAMEGAVYLVMCTQLILENNGGELAMEPGTPGEIKDPVPPNSTVTTSDLYLHAVISFVADFHALPSRSEGFFANRFESTYLRLKEEGQPVFSRNLAVRR